MKPTKKLWKHVAVGIGLIILAFILIYRFYPLSKIILPIRTLVVSLFFIFVFGYFLYKPLIAVEHRNRARMKVILLISVLILIGSVLVLFEQSKAYAGREMFTCSMYHQEKDFDKWWEINQHRYKEMSKTDFEQFPFSKGMITTFPTIKKKPELIKVGDVVSFKVNDSDYEVAHRVIKIYNDTKPWIFKTLGDNAFYPEEVIEDKITGVFVELSFFKFFERDGCER